MLWTRVELCQKIKQRHDLVCKPVINIVPLPGPRGGAGEWKPRRDKSKGEVEEKRKGKMVSGDKDSARGSFFLQKVGERGLKILITFFRI